MTSILKLSGIERSFHQAHKTLTVLKGVDLEIAAGELVGLVGASGSGKSTLLQIAGLLDKPSAGTVEIDGELVATDKDDQRTATRRDKLGFIYQFHHLLPEFSALENVALAAQIGGESERGARETARGLLSDLGLGEREDHVPAKLSGGEQQRVAIARALAANPKLILADEPTGNLDEATAARVLDLFVETVRSRGVAALIATHDMALAAKMDRRLILKDGMLHRD